MSQVFERIDSARSPWERHSGKITQQNQGSNSGGTQGLTEKWDPTTQSLRRRQGFGRPSKAVETPVLNEYHQHRLWAHVKRGSADQCWPWKAASSNFGYGRFKLDGKLYSPHRLIYAFTHGPIPDVPQFHGAVVMHSCDNPACCNPAHLKLGTQVENVGDMFAKKRAHQNRQPLADLHDGGRA